MSFSACIRLSLLKNGYLLLSWTISDSCSIYHIIFSYKYCFSCRRFSMHIMSHWNILCLCRCIEEFLKQILYYFYCPPSGTDISSIAILSEITQGIYHLLDNGNESAENINSWVSSNRASDPTLSNMSIIPVFHTFKI